MRTYTCPIHSRTFDDSGYPPSASVWCPECAIVLSDARYPAQRGYERDWNLWRSWQCNSDVPARYRNRLLQNWKPQSKAQQVAHRAVTAYAAGIRNHAGSGAGLTLLGPPGVGKTHLCCGLIAEAYRAGVCAGYAVWGDVVERTKAAFDRRDHEDKGLMEKLKSCPFLVLDEIGVRPGTEWDQAQLFGLMDYRYRQQLPTVVASNLTADTLNSIGERVADRLREANVTVTLPGESQRATAAIDQALLEAPPAFIEPEPPRIVIPVCINGEVVEREVRLERKVERFRHA